MLGFVSFIPLFDGVVATPTLLFGSAKPIPPSRRDDGNANLQVVGLGSGQLVHRVDRGPDLGNEPSPRWRARRLSPAGSNH